ncbi:MULTISPECIES: MarR family winged helix-turn-helix transcriptional regulator [unclassified Pseudodesulfovibrio]|uniref:MarR family winged helix-turn-helix transcriptional regulator n=1 Tax=unclassified Pseudodesulfovibrio TaxID=2661612 RepID=UPI000FEB820B|nr:MULTISPECIES: MarR family winged helix-turn-helix transcriptional regulator [unclassified Pseudodesulfovibrio]MCJ2165419.1 MarR family winged helix-turn-helix transcriptional regulator [Pseudodesulfovibrio sp. S3-i]RWU03172.1 MarR family transcriptional regulator [Pseudodesulfovibrio sp. S3]
MTTPSQIDRFRHFNRFYTNYLGLLADTMYNSPVSLTEARVLFEMDKVPGSSARDLRSRLGLDKGYVSRIIKGFIRQGWVETTPSKKDARIKKMTLTDKGARLMASLHRQAAGQAQGVLARLDERTRDRLLAAMADIEGILVG